MARFDVHPAPDRAGYLLDCQADLLSHLNTRLVVPLRRPAEAPIAAARLNPRFEIKGETFVMVTQFASAVPVRDLAPTILSLDDQHDRIMAALDMLITGV
jgi:toxin CcdB